MILSTSQFLQLYYLLRRIKAYEATDITLSPKKLLNNNNNKEKTFMAYLSDPASKELYGVVKVGNNINVSEEGVISLGQDLSPTSDVSFHSISSTTNITINGETAVTTVTPTASDGIALSDVVTTGPHPHFTIKNTGVLSLTAGTGIALSGSTGNVTVSTSGTNFIHVYGTTTDYTLTADDEYVGVNSVSNVTLTLPVGVTGRMYIIKDEHGQNGGKIFIKCQNTDLIDGASTYTISVPYQSVTVVYRAGQWRIV